MNWAAYGWLYLAIGIVRLATAYREPPPTTERGRVIGALITVPTLTIPVAGRLIGWW